MPEESPRSNGNINWALVLNGGMLLLVVLGYWFSTFSNPLNDKFTTLDKGLTAQQQLNSQRIDSLRSELLAQIEAQTKANALALDTVKATNGEIEKAIDRRFKAQDDGNNQLQKEIDARFAQVEKQHDIFRAENQHLLDEIERRRAEITTRSDIQTILSATRVELLSEIKRVDQRAEQLMNTSMSRKEFDAWLRERDLARKSEAARIEWLAQRFENHERDEKAAMHDMMLPPQSPKNQTAK